MSDLIVRTYAADIVHKDAKERMVYAVATGPKMDLDGQGCDPTWLRSAVPAWMQRGNIRLMHNPTIPPVGKAKQAVETPDEEWAVAIKVTDDAAWKMIEDELLTGISVGVKNATIVADARYPKGLIKGGDLIEMSLVDYPAYTSSKLATEPGGLTFFKRVGSAIQYNGTVIEDEVHPIVAEFQRLQKVAGTLEIPAAVRQRLEAQRQGAEERQAMQFGVWRNPYEGLPQMVVPHKTTGADLIKRTFALGAPDSLPADRKKVAAPDTMKDAAIQFAGDEAPHEGPVNEIIAALKQLAIQEMQEDEVDFDGLSTIAAIANQFLYGFVYPEQYRGEADAAASGEAPVSTSGTSDDMGAPLTIPMAVMTMVAEPDRSKRREMAKAIHTSLAKLATPLQEKPMTTETDAATEAEKAAKGGAGNASATNPKDSKDDGPTGGESPDGADAGGDGEGADDGKRTAKKPANKEAEADVEKVGKMISRTTAQRLKELSNAPGVPAGVRAGLQELAGFALQEGTEGKTDSMWAQVKGDTVSDGVLPRERIDGASQFGDVMAAVSASFVTPTGKAAEPDVEKVAAADLFKTNVQKIASEAAADVLSKFVTSDTFVEAISKAAQATVDAAKAADAAKVATEKVETVEKEAKADVEKVRKELGDEITRIKGLPQPAKGAVTEGTAPVDKSFVANPDETKVADTAEASLGAAIMKRALAGDPSAQRILREAIENAQPGSGQDVAAKAAYAATITGKPAAR